VASQPSPLPAFCPPYPSRQWWGLTAAHCATPLLLLQITSSGPLKQEALKDRFKHGDEVRAGVRGSAAAVKAPWRVPAALHQHQQRLLEEEQEQAQTPALPFNIAAWCHLPRASSPHPTPTSPRADHGARAARADARALPHGQQAGRLAVHQVRAVQGGA